MQYARLLQRWLAARSLTPTEAAPLLGVSFQTVYAWAGGERIPPLSRVAQLAGVLGVPETKLRRVILREQSEREASRQHGADAGVDADGATATTVNSDAEGGL